MIVYKAQNKINEKIYIGITTKSLNARIYGHLKRPGWALHNALIKYGIQSFVFSIIDVASSFGELKEKEKFWIGFYGCKAPDGYNLTAGGDGNSHPRSEETKKRISEGHKGQTAWNKGSKGVCKAWNKGKKLSDSHRLNLVISHKGNKPSEATKEKMAESAKGHPNRNPGMNHGQDGKFLKRSVQ